MNKNPNKQVRKIWLTIRLNEEEQEQLNELFKKSTCRQLSDYVRKMALHKPMNIKYRNGSIDDFLTDMLALKKELNHIGNNYNQAVHRLHSLERIADIHEWIGVNEQDKITLFAKIDAILSKVEKLYSLWSQK